MAPTTTTTRVKLSTSAYGQKVSGQGSARKP